MLIKDKMIAKHIKRAFVIASVCAWLRACVCVCVCVCVCLRARARARVCVLFFTQT